MITIFSKVAGKLARWEVDSHDHVEAINVVKEIGTTTGPVLALIENNVKITAHVTRPPSTISHTQDSVFRHLTPDAA